MSDDYGYSPKPLVFDVPCYDPPKSHKKARDPWRMLEVILVVQWAIILGLVVLLIWGIDGREQGM